MWRYVLRRLTGAVVVLFLTTLFVAYAVRLSGDPTVAMFQGGSAPTPDQLAQMRAALGIDRPFWQQYTDFVVGAVQGDMGTSFRTGQPVWAMIVERLPATVMLAVSAMAVAILISFPLGVAAALRHGQWVDSFSRLLSLFGLSFPNFWLAIMFMLIFAVRLGWFPPSGFDGWRSLVLPAVTLGIILSATLVRLVRSSMLEVLGQPYIETARAKGVPEWRVVVAHGLRNALIPTVTFVGLQFGALLGGTVILEKVFAWPGLGQLALDAVGYRDYPVVQGVVTVLAAVTVLTNLLVDLSYGLLDPRVKVEGGASS
ncbi:nickel ABC transporter permease [Thermaerobacter subterraneus]|uniref:Nickel import system permease protein NikB n=1 Tax=Thermaerobacter subterraneus DSM 13965 TaxID=867903 RepID=K6P402_9FIRM|nr:nickel ABC transporter permease [Thermaerobacter subterraneus]EKP95780.1 ABC-type dipeptide/oligopeptide/nickel transport system, permease component [Thermaerobacter subterraneus DSM 13965]